MSNKVEHAADVGRPGDTVKRIIMEFTIVLGFVQTGREVLDDGSTENLAEKKDKIKVVWLYSCAGYSSCGSSNGRILAWKTVGALRTLVMW
jgi:hypothetical protein